MGFSPKGILFYGYDLGRSDSEWHLREVDGPGWKPVSEGHSHLDAEKKLLASAGFTETDWRVDGYWAREREARSRLGITLGTHCSSEYPEYHLATFALTASWEDSQQVDFAALEKMRSEQDWDGKLRKALQTLGIMPKQDVPRWLLVAHYS